MTHGRMFRTSSLSRRLASRGSTDRRWHLVSLLMALLLQGCGPETETLPPDIVARVGNQVISQERLQRELNRRTQISDDIQNAAEFKRQTLEEVIRFEAAYEKAIAAGYDRDAQMADTLKRMIVAKYEEDQLGLLPQPQVTWDEIERYYKDHADWFGTPERLRAAIIQLQVPSAADPERQSAAAGKMEQIRTAAMANPAPDGTFGLLAQNSSDDQASRYRGGDIGWFIVKNLDSKKTGLDRRVIDALSSLKEPGEISPVIQTANALYLVRLVERQPASQRPLTEVADGVKYLLGRERSRAQREKMLDQALTGLVIRTNKPLLDALEVPVLNKGSNGPPLGPMPQVKESARQITTAGTQP